MRVQVMLNDPISQMDIKFDMIVGNSIELDSMLKKVMVLGGQFLDDDLKCVFEDDTPEDIVNDCLDKLKQREGHE